MRNPLTAVEIERALGHLGLFLMLVVAGLANHGGFLARRAIDGIAAIGWLVDHLPLPATANGGLR